MLGTGCGILSEQVELIPLKAFDTKLSMEKNESPFRRLAAFATLCAARPSNEDVCTFLYTASYLVHFLPFLFRPHSYPRRPLLYLVHHTHGALSATFSPLRYVVVIARLFAVTRTPEPGFDLIGGRFFYLRQCLGIY